MIDSHCWRFCGNSFMSDEDNEPKAQGAESEAGEANPEDPWFRNLPRCNTQVKHLVTGMEAIEIVADGLLNGEQREALGRAPQAL
ncbi:hypothetical protein [Ottowia sp.]|jgi:hypothetical protein|uniref:hypothetical protein n=1 Tax=Ottowia sp. TaxID=1898956 RepID=UPI002612F09F|nr:hypothetical protein [Ottowia sp.]